MEYLPQSLSKFVGALTPELVFGIKLDWTFHTLMAGVGVMCGEPKAYMCRKAVKSHGGVA